MNNRQLGWIKRRENGKGVAWNKGKKLPYTVWMKGKKHTEIAKEKNRAAHLGRKLTEEHKKKISEANSGEKAYQWKGGINYVIARRARLRGAVGSHTQTEWAELKKQYNYMCLCCKQQEPFVKLSEDHIVPLSMGGSNHIENIQPLCGPCNSRKYTSSMDYRKTFGQVTVA